ncbi:MAG: amidohydrolase family protein [Chloroflexi bacterium]|nr:amidohydrolase family protein [Chloroflexota bacterium]
MATTLIRGRYVITSADAPAIAHGAVLVDGHVVTAVGRADELTARAPGARVLGSDDHLVIPGLVNSHSHGRGLGSFQLGALDDQLEVWINDRRPHRLVDQYWDTLLATINLVESGVTSVLHSHATRNAAAYEAEMDQALAAYQDAGLRVGFAPGLRWCRNFVYEDDAAFAAMLPQPLRARFEHFVGQPHARGPRAADDAGALRLAERVRHRPDGQRRRVVRPQPQRQPAAEERHLAGHPRARPRPQRRPRHGLDDHQRRRRLRAGDASGRQAAPPAGHLRA